MVYILARKVLLRNTRIFKQASSLTSAGYQVTVIGILPLGGQPIEYRDGYRILRVPLDPVYVRWPRRLRRRANWLNQRLLRLPGRYLRTVFLVRRRWRRLTAGSRRTLRRLNRAGRRVWMRLWGRGESERSSQLWFPRAVGTAIYAVRTFFMRLWLSLGRALDADRSAGSTAISSPLMQILLSPLILLTNVIRWLSVNAVRAFRGVRDRRLVYTLARAVARGFAKLLRALSEFMITRLSLLLRRFAWPLKSVEYYKQVYRLVVNDLGPPDIVHANDLDTLWVASRLAKRYSVPLVYDAQELYVGLHTLPRWYRTALTAQEWLLLRKVDRVIAVNDAIGDLMARRYRVQIDQVVLNCPPLDEVHMAAGAPTIHQRLGLPDGERVLVYSGALTPKRGLENTLLALESLERVSLVILGEGPLRSRLETLALEHGLRERVFFLDFVPHIEVPAYISSAQLGVIPYERVGINHYLCSPSKLFHYVMAGVPIVCSDFPFLRRVVVDNGVGAVFDPSQPLSIAAAARAVLETPGEAEACRQRLRTIRHRYSWEEQAGRFLAVYSSLDRGNQQAIPEVRAANGAESRSVLR